MKYKITSYQSCPDDVGRGFLFTIQEAGMSGEARQYADEIISSKASWRDDFSSNDAEKIVYAAKLVKNQQT